MKKSSPESIDFITFIGLHAAQGTAAGIAIASLLVLFNAGGVKDLRLATGEPYVLLALFLLSFSSIVATLDVAIAVMSIGPES